MVPTSVYEAQSRYFSDRLTEMGKRRGANVIRLEKPRGATVTDDEAAEFIHRAKPKVVGFAHAERSIGALQSGRAICAAAHDAVALVIADCVTSLGGIPVHFEQTGLDVAYSCTQKGLRCPPACRRLLFRGGPLDWLCARTSPACSWYFDLKLIHDYSIVSHRYHHGPDFHVLCLTPGTAGHRGGGNRETLGTASPLP